MTNKFTSLKLLIESNRLTVLHVAQPSTLLIQSGDIWLTHSKSNQDYVLHAGQTFSVSRGLVLMSSVARVDASVHVRECGYADSTFARFKRGLLHAIKPLPAVQQSVCVHMCFD